MGPITLTDDTILSTNIVIAVVLLVLFLTFKKSQHTDVFPISVTNELKGLGILTVVFAHFAYMKVTNADFLFPLSIIAGVGVDLFLFMSGYGLSVGMLKRPMKTLDFYKKRVIKIFIPFWVALIIIFAADAIFLKEKADVKLFLDNRVFESWSAKISNISYKPEITPEQTVAYKITAEFNDLKENRDLPKIGLRGTAKIYSEEVTLFFYLFRKPITSLRQLLAW